MPEYKVELGPEDNARLEAIRRREDCGAAQAFRVALRRATGHPRIAAAICDVCGADGIAFDCACKPYPQAAHGELRGGGKR